MIKDVFKKEKIKNYKIYPVPDLYNDKKWAGHIKKNPAESRFFLFRKQMDDKMPQEARFKYKNKKNQSYQGDKRHNCKKQND